MARNTTTSILLLFAIATPGCAGCGDSPVLGTCDKQADLTGHWVIHATPPDADGGVVDDVVPRSFTLDANLVQVKSSAAFNVGYGVWGSFTSQDKGVFDQLQIPQLMKNNGGKTGAQLSCTIKVNIPIAMPVTDDNKDQGPLRLAIEGQIVQNQMMLGDPEKSLVIMVDDASMVPRHFAWTATQP